MKYIVKKIMEPDYGCEEHPDDYVAMRELYGDYRFQDVRIITIKTMVSLLDMLRMESKIYIEKDILLQRFTNRLVQLRT